MVNRIEKGICGIFPANCGVEISLENDRIVKILPWKTHIQGIPLREDLLINGFPFSLAMTAH